MKPHLIAICGAIGSGKSSVADYLVAEHTYWELSFAAPLKEIAIGAFSRLGVRGHAFIGTQADKAAPIPGLAGPDGEPVSGRRILEHLGTEGFRGIDPDVWVKMAMATVDREAGRVVISDARFPNELDAVKARGGQVWYVEKIGGEQRFTGHASDVAWQVWLSEHGPDCILKAHAGDMAGLRDAAAAALL